MIRTCYWIATTLVLASGPPYWYVIPPHICNQYSYILLQSNTYIDCTTVTVIFLPLVALTDTERWLDGLLYCSRYWTFITIIGWCCLLLNTPPEWKSRLKVMIPWQTNDIANWKLLPLDCLQLKSLCRENVVATGVLFHCWALPTQLMLNNACVHYQVILESPNVSRTAPVPHLNIPGTL